jgi:predicted metal-binding protein
MAIEKQPTPWTEAIITICEKCGKSLDDLKLIEEGNAAENLKRYLKGRFRTTENPKKVRVVTSSCLDVCIKNKVALSYNPVAGSKQTQQVFTVHPEEDREELFQLINK